MHSAPISTPHATGSYRLRRGIGRFSELFRER